MSTGGSQSRPTRPDQDTVVLIHRQALAVNDLVLEGLEVLVIELEVQLEGPIGQASTPLQHGHCLVQHLLKGHGLPFRVCKVPGNACYNAPGWRH